jgi:putative membrane protein
MTGPTDPRVLFAAERTLFSWNRTGISLMAFGFVVERFGLYMQILGVQGVLGAQRHLSFIGGMGFILLGAFVEIYSVLQHRHFLASLHEMDIPVGYNTRAAMAINAAVGFMGVMLCGYLFLGVL